MALCLSVRSNYRRLLLCFIQIGALLFLLKFFKVDDILWEKITGLAPELGDFRPHLMPGNDIEESSKASHHRAHKKFKDSIVPPLRSNSSNKILNELVKEYKNRKGKWKKTEDRKNEEIQSTVKEVIEEEKMNERPDANRETQSQEKANDDDDASKKIDLETTNENLPSNNQFSKEVVIQEVTNSPNESTLEEELEPATFGESKLAEEISKDETFSFEAEDQKNDQLQEKVKDLKKQTLKEVVLSIPSGEEIESNLVDNILGSLSLPNEHHNPINFQNLDEDIQIQRQLLEEDHTDNSDLIDNMNHVDVGDVPDAIQLDDDYTDNIEPENLNDETDVVTFHDADIVEGFELDDLPVDVEPNDGLGDDFVDEILLEEDADVDNDYDIDKEDDYDDNYDIDEEDNDDVGAVEGGENENPDDVNDEQEIEVLNKNHSEPIVAKIIRNPPVKNASNIPVSKGTKSSRSFNITGTCRLQLVETVPIALINKNFAKKMAIEHVSTIKAWNTLVNLTNKKVEIVSQWGIGHSGKGALFFQNLARGVKHSNISVRIVYTNKFKKNSYHTPTDLKKMSPDKVEIRIPSIERKLDGKTRGIIHSKIIVADKKHFYIGSANLGSRGASWTKEVGVLVTNCPELGADASKLVQLYWELGDLKGIPKKFSSNLATKFGSQNPFKLLNPADDTYYNVYLGSSPKALCAPGRTDDLSAILDVIDKAEKFIYIAVGEYVAMDLFKQHNSWNVIDVRLRKAIRDRKVVVKYLGNENASHKNWMKKNLISLMMTYNKPGAKKIMVEAKLYDANIRNFKGSHNKFMVTDKAAYIGTSNWSEDYFTTTAGIAIIFEPTGRVKGSSLRKNLPSDMREELEHIFMRDFNSPLAKPIEIPKGLIKNSWINQ